VLIFLPGVNEIRSLQNRLVSSRTFSPNNSSFDVIPLHSKLNQSEQRAPFLKNPNRQKIILSTNIAETSVTISDCVCVIDTGLVREIRVNRRSGGEMLVSTFTSRASSKQRAGRAGRIRPGICLKLFSSETERKNMPADTTPELQRVPLEDVCLSVLSMGDYNCHEFLSGAPQPPKESAIADALKMLKSVGCIEYRKTAAKGQREGSGRQVEKLTDLGKCLSHLPTQVKIAKIVLFGVLFGCAKEILDICGCLTSGRPLFFSSDCKEAVRSSLNLSDVAKKSDFLALGKLFDRITSLKTEKGERACRAWCEKNSINFKSFQEADECRSSLEKSLIDRDLLPRTRATATYMPMATSSSVHETDVRVSLAIAAALMPDVCSADLETGEITCSHNERVFMGKESANTKALGKKPRGGTKHLLFYEKFSTSANRTWITYSQFVTNFQLVLFSGEEDEGCSSDLAANECVVESWVKVQMKSKVVVEIEVVKRRFKNILARCWENGGKFAEEKDVIFLRDTLTQMCIIAK